MTNPQTEPDVELEEGEIEDDGCDVEADSSIGKSDCNGIESSKLETKSENDVKDKEKPSNGIKINKKSSRHKEKGSGFNNKKKYVFETKSTDWRDMLYEPEDDAEGDFYQELEEVKKRLTADISGHSDSESLAEDEDDKEFDDKLLRNSKRFEGEEPSKFQSRHHADKKSKITCKFFLDGNCMKGSECHYSHDKSKIREKDVCKSYKAMGFCPYGKKCRYIHFDGLNKAKKESAPRKRRISSESEDVEQPPKKKIPSLLDLNVVPKGQSEEDAGKVLMMAAKRSTLLQKSKSKKALLGTPERPKKSEDKVTRIMKVSEEFESLNKEEEEERSDEEMDFQSIQDNFGDKDERPSMNYHDIDERQMHISDKNNVGKMEEETYKNHQPLNNNINVRALLGTAPPTVGSSRPPLLGKEPPNFNFHQFQRPPLRPSPPPLALTQTLGLIINQNMNPLLQQSRMLNPGLLPHPINPPRGPNGGFNSRPFVPSMGMNSMPPTSFMGPQNIGCNIGQMPSNPGLLPIPMNLPCDPPFTFPNGPLTMPGQFIPEEAKLYQNESSKMVVEQRMDQSSVISLKDQMSINLNQKQPSSFERFQNMDAAPELLILGGPQIEESQKSVGFNSFQDKDLRFISDAQATTKPFGLFQNEMTSSPPLPEAEDLDIVPLTINDSIADDTITTNQLELADDKTLNKINIPDAMSPSDEVQANQSTSSPSTNHEISSISLSAANEVSFDCKLKGPYCLRIVDVDAKITIPDFMLLSKEDARWSSDPRFLKHKDDPIQVKKTPSARVIEAGKIAAKHEKPSSPSAKVSVSSSVIQTRDPRLQKRSRKEVDKGSTTLPAQVTSTETVNDPLRDFLRKYSNLSPSELDKIDSSQAAEVKTDKQPEQQGSTAVLSENSKKSYQSLIVKKSSKISRSGNNSDAAEEEADDQKSKKPKMNIETFQSPLMSTVYPATTMQYGLPPNGRLRDSQKPPEPIKSSDLPPVPESSPFAPSCENSESGCVKSLFNNIDPTASPFL